MKTEFPSEQFIEDYVYDQLNDGWPCPVTGEPAPDFVYRQFEIIGYGITDIIKVNVWPRFLSITILELKNETLKAAHVEQLCRYVAGMLRMARPYQKRGFDVRVYGELAGPFQPTDVIYLAKLVSSHISLWDISLSMENGFESEEVGRGWFNKNEAPSQAKPFAREFYDKAKEEFCIDQWLKEQAEKEKSLKVIK